MCCRGDPEIDLTAINKDKSISKILASDRKRLGEEIRLLLLGAGESGKSTIAKQMKIIHLGGFNPEELSEYITIIHTNIYDSIKAITKASDTLGIPLANKENIEFGKSFLEPFTTALTPEDGEKIEQFYSDEGVKEIIKSRSADFQLPDNTLYYAKDIRRICAMGYIPNESDVLHSRVQTTGVIETSFYMNDRKFTLVDVGGQRSERKKWIHCFDNVSGVLFCVGISAFNQTLYEDNTTNRMQEALKLFHEICMSKWFSKTAIILFLNKDDLFREKLAKGKNIRVAFPDYKGDNSYETSVAFIIDKFTDVKDPITEDRREIYCHVTTATDTRNVMVVFDAVRDFIVTQALSGCGLLAT